MINITEKKLSAAIQIILGSEGIHTSKLEEDLVYGIKALSICEVSKSFLYKDEKLIENMCFSFRHDFGLMDSQKQNELRIECKEWLRALENNQ